MANLASENVFVFPSARRAQQDDIYNNSRLMGEKSIVDIYDNIVSVDSYIISESYSDTMEFIIGGYDFVVSGLNTLLTNFSDALEIWASIELDSGVPDFPELVGKDTGGNYTGLNFVSEEPTGEDIKKLKLLYRNSTSDDWAVVESSTKRFYYSQIYFLDTDIIDGGIVLPT